MQKGGVMGEGVCDCGCGEVMGWMGVGETGH